MRERARTRLARFGERVQVLPFRLEEHDWRTTLPADLRCVVSSLCVHHLTADEKKALFADMYARLTPGGALLLADIVEPANPRLANVYARAYDAVVREQSLARFWRPAWIRAAKRCPLELLHMGLWRSREH